ncbi:MAG: hypothetical protein COB02_01590 [Candidatus Cloacimonadota bacterium]|nr:MAG: hypothetical protein COB02_01590 [Candidatus Cloacimonadota bacterium]
MNQKIKQIFQFHRSTLNSYQTKSIQKFVKKFNLNINFTPHFVIGGTNGKGSLCKILSSIYKKSSYKIGLFVSPHLHSYNERIQVNHKNISDKEFINIYQELSPSLKKAGKENIHLSFFELILIISLIHFKNKKVDLMIYEVGLGGKRDATQILNPIFSTITNVSLDHTHILGDTIQKIAIEKSGNIFENSSFLYPKKDKLSTFFESICNIKKSRFYATKRLISSNIHNKNGFKGFFSWENKNHPFSCNLKGENQSENLNNALNIIQLNQKKFPVKVNDIQSSLIDINHECRLEIISQSPLIFVDGSHNIEGILYLKKWLENHFSDYEIYISIAFKNNKNSTQSIQELKKIAIVSSYTPKFKGFLKKNDFLENILHFNNYKTIYDSYFKISKKKKILLFTGSLKSAIIQKRYFKKYIKQQ